MKVKGVGLTKVFRLGFFGHKLVNAIDGDRVNGGGYLGLLWWVNRRDFKLLYRHRFSSSGLTANNRSSSLS